MLYSLWFRRYAPFATFGVGFEGDDRTAGSTDMAATARTIAGVGFGKGGEVIGGGGSSSGTNHRLWPFGDLSARVNVSVRVESQTTSTLRFVAHSAGGNPMIPGSPDIDTFVDVTAVFSDALLQISGEVRGDDFPNAEVFIYDGTGASRLLFHFETSRGRNTGPMTGLWGANADQVLGRFAELIPLHPDGAFRIMVDHARARVPVRTSADAARTPVDWGPRPRVPIAAGSN